MLQNWFEGLNLRSGDSEKKSQRTTTISGYLFKMKRKQNSITGQWTNRFFTIEGRKLKWYASSASEEYSGALDLATLSDVKPFEGNSHSFIINSPTRNLLLRASSRSEMDKWVRVLHMQADYAKGGDGTSIVTASGSSPSSKKPTNKGKGQSLESKIDETLRALDELEYAVKSSNNGNKGSVNDLSKQFQAPKAAPSSLTDDTINNNEKAATRINRKGEKVKRFPIPEMMADEGITASSQRNKETYVPSRDANIDRYEPPAAANNDYKRSQKHEKVDKSSTRTIVSTEKVKYEVANDSGIRLLASPTRRELMQMSKSKKKSTNINDVSKFSPQEENTENVIINLAKGSSFQKRSKLQLEDIDFDNVIDEDVDASSGYEENVHYNYGNNGNDNDDNNDNNNYYNYNYNNNNNNNNSNINNNNNSNNRLYESNGINKQVSNNVNKGSKSSISNDINFNRNRSNNADYSKNDNSYNNNDDSNKCNRKLDAGSTIWRNAETNRTNNAWE